MGWLAEGCRAERRHAHGAAQRLGFWAGLTYSSLASGPATMIESATDIAVMLGVFAVAALRGLDRASRRLRLDQAHPIPWPYRWPLAVGETKKERSGLQSACDELIDKSAIITGEWWAVRVRSRASSSSDRGPVDPQSAPLAQTRQ
jgi:hypothetical protein